MFVIPDAYEVEKHSDPLELKSQVAAGHLMFKREFLTSEHSLACLWHSLKFYLHGDGSKVPAQ